MCFFFSSRRRHTRLQGDWSSDVCSSDLLRFCSHDLNLLLTVVCLRQNIEQQWVSEVRFNSRDGRSSTGPRGRRVSATRWKEAHRPRAGVISIPRPCRTMLGANGLPLVNRCMDIHARVRRTASVERGELRCQHYRIHQVRRTMSTCHKMDFCAQRLHETVAGSGTGASTRRVTDSPESTVCRAAVRPDNPSAGVEQRSINRRIGKICRSAWASCTKLRVIKYSHPYCYGIAVC